MTSYSCCIQPLCYTHIFIISLLDRPWPCDLVTLTFWPQICSVSYVCESQAVFPSYVRLLEYFVLVSGLPLTTDSTRSIFRAFGRYVFGTLGNEANVIIQYYLVACRLSSDSKIYDLDDLDWLFRVNCCFRAGLAGWDRATTENNCMKTNKERHTLLVVQIFGRDSSFWQYKVCVDIRSGSLERRL